MTGVILLTGIVIFSTLAHGAVELWALTALQSAVIVLAAMQMTGAVRCDKPAVVKTPADLPLVVFLCAACLSYAISAYPHVSRIQAFKLIIYAVLFYAVIHAADTRRRLMTLATGIVLFGVIYAGAGMIAGSGSLFGMKLFSSGRYNISLTFPNHSHFAGFLELIIWLSLALAFVHRGAKRALFVCFTVYIAAAVAFSLSRGGFLGFLGGLCFLCAAAVFSRTRKKNFRIIAVFMISLTALIVWLGAEPFIRRIETLNDPLTADRTRILVWQKTMQIIADHPAFGTGIGTFPYIFPMYQPPSLSHSYANHAHNDYLELASEIGISGLLIALAGVSMLFYSVLKQLNSHYDRMCHAVGVGALAGCFSLLVHAFGDFNFHIPSNAVLFSVCAGMAAASARLANPAAVSYRFRFGASAFAKRAAYAVIVIVAGASLMISASPTIAGVYIRKAQAYQIQKEYEQAETHVRKATRIDPGNACHAAFLGDLAVNRFRGERKTDLLRQALEHYDRAIELCPPKSMFHTKKAFALAAAERFDDAEASFKQAVDYDPSNPFVYKDLARFWLNRKQYEPAFALYQEAILTDSRQLTAVLNELWDAELDYERMKKAVPDRADLRKQFASFLYSKKYYRASTDELATAFSLEPTADHAAEHLRGLIRIKDDQNAVQTAERYALRFPDNRPLKKQLASLYAAAEDLEKAVLTYEALLRSDPDDPSIYPALAGVYQKMNLNDEGIDLLKKGIEINPKQPDLYISLANLYRWMNRHEDAAAVLTDGVRLNPDAAALYTLLADCYRRTQQPDKAIGVLKKLVSLHSSNPSYLLMMGEEYRKNGLFHEAAEQWKKCLDIQPRHQGCQNALNSLYEHLGILSIK